MANVINATSTGNGGLVSTGDDSGILNIQTNETTAITVDTSQNVGIGTTSPVAKLDVSSSSAGVTAGDLVVDTANKTVYVGRQSSTSGDNSYLVVRGRVNGSGTNQAIAITGDTSAYGTGLFRPGNDILGFSTLATERMRIDSSGNLSVGTTSNIARIGAVFDGATANGCVLRTSTNASGTGFLYFQQDTNTCGVVTRVGTTSAVTYATTSDYRLKENIAPMTGALSRVARLKPVTYTWKSGGESAEGFIAHELAEVCPDAVVGTKDAVDADGNPKYQSIDVSFLVATLTAALQETKALIDTQAETINALTARIVALEGQ